jgi:hypothetical protein
VAPLLSARPVCVSQMLAACECRAGPTFVDFCLGVCVCAHSSGTFLVLSLRGAFEAPHLHPAGAAALRAFEDLSCELRLERQSCRVSDFLSCLSAIFMFAFVRCDFAAVCVQRQARWVQK